MRRTIESRPSVGSIAKIVVRRAITLPQVTAAQTTIVIVRSGTLEVSRNGNSRQVREHQVIVLPAGMAFDIAYTMSERSLFVADWLIPAVPNDAPNASTQEMAELGWLPVPMDGAVPQFRQALEKAIAGIITDKVHDAIAQRRMQEVIQWIAVHGGCVCDSAISSDVSRIWRIIATDPMHEWCHIEIAELIGVSVTRLQSILRRDGITFARLIHDVRMGRALALLLATDIPIHAIASDSGYRCATQFRTRFCERYGLLPIEVRGQDLKTRSRCATPARSRLPAFLLHVPARAATGAGRAEELAPHEAGRGRQKAPAV